MKVFDLQLSCCSDEIVELHAQVINQGKNIGDSLRLFEIPWPLGDQKVTLEFIE